MFLKYENCKSKVSKLKKLNFQKLKIEQKPSQNFAKLFFLKKNERKFARNSKFCIERPKNFAKKKFNILQ